MDGSPIQPDSMHDPRHPGGIRPRSRGLACGRLRRCVIRLGTRDVGWHSPQVAEPLRPNEPVGPMNNLRRALVVTALAAGLAAPVLPAQALEVEGHNYADTVTVAGVPLKLNGAGVLSQLWLKAFTVGLYLPRQTTQVSGVLAQPGAKRLRLRLLVDVPSKELVKALNRGVEKNHTEADRAPLAARLARLSELVQGMGKLAVGDAIDLDFRPGAGLALSLNG